MRDKRPKGRLIVGVPLPEVQIRAVASASTNLYSQNVLVEMGRKKQPRGVKAVTLRKSKLTTGTNNLVRIVPAITAQGAISSEGKLSIVQADNRKHTGLSR